jgi:integrase
MTATATRSKRGTGSCRERRPGAWEVRVTTGTDLESGLSLQRSFTHHGDQDSAEKYRSGLVEKFRSSRRSRCGMPAPITVQDLLDAFLSAPHRWSATTWRSYRGQAAMLCRDRIRRIRVDWLMPDRMERIIERWTCAGVTPSNLSGRFRTLHAAITWAIINQLLTEDPLAGMSCPARPDPRLHLLADQVTVLIRAADHLVDCAYAAVTEQPHRSDLVTGLFRAEQDALLVRLGADSAARRGELAALKTTDLVKRKLTIERASQDGVIGPVKNHLKAGLTLGQDTALYWKSHVENWSMVPQEGPWLFSSSPHRTQPLLPNGLGQRFDKLARAAGVPGASLHRLRHTVGTYLISQGKILEASQRLRHRDLTTTLREYGHALPMHDEDVADGLARLYGL